MYQLTWVNHRNQLFAVTSPNFETLVDLYAQLQGKKKTLVRLWGKDKELIA